MFVRNWSSRATICERICAYAVFESGEGAAANELALDSITAKHTTTTLVIRISLSLLSQLENDPQYCGGIHRLAFPLRGFETNLLGCADGCFIQSVSKTIDDAQHLHLAGRREQYFELYFTFDLQLATFVGVNRVGLVDDFNRCGRSRNRKRFFLGFVRYRACIAEAALLDLPTRRAPAAGPDRYTIAEACARYHTGTAVAAARSIALAWTCRKIE